MAWVIACCTRLLTLLFFTQSSLVLKSSCSSKRSWRESRRQTWRLCQGRNGQTGVNHGLETRLQARVVVGCMRTAALQRPRLIDVLLAWRQTAWRCGIRQCSLQRWRGCRWHSLFALHLFHRLIEVVAKRFYLLGLSYGGFLARYFGTSFWMTRQCRKLFTSVVNTFVSQY